MQKTLLLIFSLFLTINLSAQSGTCMPDTTVIDSTGLGVVFPLPFDTTTMTGGIPITACVNQPFEFSFTAAVPGTIDVNGFMVGLNYMEIAATDGVNGLPDGLTYACNPPDCHFDAETFGCVVIYGTPTATNVPGPFNLTMDLLISTTALGDIPSTEPGGFFPGAYTLVLEPEDSGTCFVVSTTDVLTENLSFNTAPNPFADFTQINITSGIHQDVSLEVYNLLGKQLFQQDIRLQEGDNTIDFDATDLVDGMYIYSLRKGNQMISKRMIVSK